MAQERAVVIGAGVGGLVAALELAVHGLETILLEKEAAPGGKMRTLLADGAAIDSGPTVFTMRWVFDEIFDDAGRTLGERLSLKPASVLARHAWGGGDRFDLFADAARAADEVARFADPAEAKRFMAFCQEARRVYRTLERPFLASQRPGPMTLAARVGLAHALDFAAIRPFETLWRALGQYFRDPRLRQLFGRYATYSGSNPFLAPATLMLIAHVEQDGVWLVEGGMNALAQALAALAIEKGVTIRTGATVTEIIAERGRVSGVTLADGERIDCDVVVCNADCAAAGLGLLGGAAQAAVDPTPAAERSLSAITWSMRARADGFALIRHNVFFSGDYAAEFRALGAGRLPQAPTIYVCAQDRGDDGAGPGGPERLLVLVNAPARGDEGLPDAAEIARCERTTFSFLEACGLTIERRPETSVRTVPADFARLFPGTSGALYGRATHGPWASFRRPAARTRLPGLYLAGGSAHPGAGVPMAALSGRLAAEAILADLGSTGRSRPADTPGGTSTP